MHVIEVKRCSIRVVNASDPREQNGVNAAAADINVAIIRNRCAGIARLGRQDGRSPAKTRSKADKIGTLLCSYPQGSL